MKVIIAGSRQITDFDLVYQALNECGFEVTEVVSGGAKGVDTLGEEWAHWRDLPTKRFLPAWDKLGKWAGFERNKQMADYADALVAIWDGKSRGTLDMINKAKAKGIPFVVYQYTPASIKRWPWHEPTKP